MVAETVAPRASVAFPEDWHANLPPGPPFELDAMHFPFPVSPLYASHANGAGFITALREYQVPVTDFDSVFRNHYRFGRMMLAKPGSEAEAAELFGPAEAAIAAEVSRLLERWHGEHLPRLRELLARLDALDPILSELAEGEEEVIEIADELWTIHFRIVIPMMLAMQVFDELHADIFGGSVDDSHVLLVGAVSESIKAGFGLSDLAREARALGLAQAILEASPDNLVASLERADGGAAFLARLDAYLTAYGWRQDLLDYMTPTWIEDPSFALATIRSYLQTGRDLRAEHAHMARSAEDALRNARERLAAWPEPVRGQFETLLQAARAAMFLQEEHNFYIDQQGTAKLRFYYLRVGQRLVDAGLIDQPDNVLMLTSQELVDVASTAADPSLPATLRQRVATRRRELELANGLTPPPFLGDTPPSPPPFSNPMMRGNARFWGTPVDQPEDSRELAGMAGSRGRATGVARVARTLEDAKALQPGEILVAVTTMPPWTPLFAIAAAVVTETGGPLSHCAIVAREYGIPAVVGVPGATTRIATGEVITVDGGTGSVTIND